MHWNLIIATWNRCVLLRQTLESILAMQTPRRLTWDITVADNHSTDDTAALVHSLQASFQNHLQYVHEPRQGKSYALNAALAKTQGDWVLFLDDDVRVDPGLLQGYCQAMERHPHAAALGGAIEPWIPWGQLLGEKQRWLLEQYPACFGWLQVKVDTPMTPPQTSAWGANMMVRRRDLPVQGFATDKGMVAGKRIAGEDVGLVMRVLEAPGNEGWLVPDAIVHHYTPISKVTWKRLWQWQRAIGAGWTSTRGRPAPGRWGIPWWAWREMLRRGRCVLWQWRASPTPAFGKAMVEAAQWWGYLKNG